MPFGADFSSAFNPFWGNFPTLEGCVMHGSAVSHSLEEKALHPWELLLVLQNRPQHIVQAVRASPTNNTSNYQKTAEIYSSFKLTSVFLLNSYVLASVHMQCLCVYIYIYMFVLQQFSRVFVGIHELTMSFVSAAEFSASVALSPVVWFVVITLQPCKQH